ncbi:MAG: bifunctional diaminohydroxyphosphoribosylaminopyrimidine deaminase/5-amino-6-(5-phosphoribosylamino)uracil reductase RibD, partial [Muribaculaceae bacterium]|nr:bifunctional diaminohydroxyphosphoribosylaminopyrimidine deaminase/5-amino-6-(5-phosphoribosylamino)uracil reductase RibD [Muribaculaceae bacterium]
PNPMVGAVIVRDGRIIGEGYHRRCGEGHAEVNAVASVTARRLLDDCTMYVTLEPCSHYGKTPPCAKLIIDSGIPRVVIGAVDPFEKVAGRGIAMLREAGVEVVSGVMEKECRELNVVFFTAHTRRRPFVTLKWARSADGFMDRRRLAGEPAARFSNELTAMLTHRLRSVHDAILTSSATVNADNPLLTVRSWYGRDPQPVIIDRRGVVNPEAALLGRDPIIYNGDSGLRELLDDLYSAHGITSVLVEAGPRLLQSFIDHNLWDAARVETSPVCMGENGIAPSPVLVATPSYSREVAGNRLDYYGDPVVGM